MRSIAAFSVVALVLGTATTSAQFQSLPAGLEQTVGTSGTSDPLANTPDGKWHFVYDTRHFPLNTCIRITELYFRPKWSLSTQYTVAAFSYANLTVTMAYAANDYRYATYATNFAANMLGSVQVRTGPLSAGPFAPGPGPVGTWVPLGLQVPFDYDPTLGFDLVIEVAKCGTTSSWGTQLDVAIGSVGGLGAMRYGNTSSCTAASWTTTQFNPVNESAPIVGIAYVPNFGGCANSLGQYQTNHYGASVSIDGASDPGTLVPMNYARFGGEAGVANLRAGAWQTGRPFDFLLTAAAPAVPANAGGLVTAGGQKVNVDPLLATWILGGATASFAVPWPGSIDARFRQPAAASTFTYATQLLILDPTMPDGFNLSHVQNVTVAPPPGDIVVEASGPTDRNADVRRGFWRVLHLGGAAATPRDPITRVVLDWSASSVPAQTARHFDAGAGGVTDRFEGGNSVAPGCRGTYRKASDIVCGLDYSGTPASICDPAANTGARLQLPHSTYPTNLWFRRLEFNFAPGVFTGQTFEFDCPTVVPPSSTAVPGGAMAGLAVTVTTTSPTGTPTSYTGFLTLDPTNASRASVAF